MEAPWRFIFGEFSILFFFLETWRVFSLLADDTCVPLERNIKKKIIIENYREAGRRSGVKSLNVKVRKRTPTWVLIF